MTDSTRGGRWAFIMIMVVAALVLIGAAITISPRLRLGQIRTAALSEIENQVETRLQSESSWGAAENGHIVSSGGQVQTHAASKAKLEFDDETIVRLSERTLFTLSDPEVIVEGALPRLVLETGRVFVVLEGEHSEEFEIETPVGVAAVRGSIMWATFDPVRQSLSVGCLTGHCAIRNDQGETELTDGEQAKITMADQPPSVPTKISSENLELFLEVPEAILLLPTPTSTPVPTGLPANDNPTAEFHVVLPPLPCTSAQECTGYCGVDDGRPSTPPPPECMEFEQQLEEQGVNMDGFVVCVLGGRPMQACADENVEASP